MEMRWMRGQQTFCRIAAAALSTDICCNNGAYGFCSKLRATFLETICGHEGMYGIARGGKHEELAPRRQQAKHCAWTGKMDMHESMRSRRPDYGMGCTAMHKEESIKS